jgi:hypothetical protein
MGILGSDSREVDQECQGRSRKSTTSDVAAGGQAIISIGIDVARIYA